MKICHWLAGLAAIAVLLAGCGEGSKVADAETSAPKTPEIGSAGHEVLQRAKCQSPARGVLRVSLNSRVGPDNVAAWVARRRGFFSDAGVQTRVLSPIVPNRPVRYLTLRVDDVAFAQAPQAVIAKTAGAPLVVLGSVISQSTAAMIWLKSSGIESVADLEGKTIAYPGVPFQEALLKTILARVGLSLTDVKLEAVGYRLVPTLLSGEADAIFGGSWNIEGKTLEVRGADPVVKRVGTLGVPGYQELVVVAQRNCAARYPRVYRDFMAALTRAVVAIRRNPGLATRQIREIGERNPELKPPEIKAQVSATLPLLARNPRLDLGQAAQLTKWMDQNGLIEGESSTSGLFNNAYLP